MEDGEDYYLIQNSYGKQWGLNVVLGSDPLAPPLEACILYLGCYTCVISMSY